MHSAKPFKGTEEPHATAEERLVGVSAWQEAQGNKHDGAMIAETKRCTENRLSPFEIVSNPRV
jgi:hypothetical protein